MYSIQKTTPDAYEPPSWYRPRYSDSLHCSFAYCFVYSTPSCVMYITHHEHKASRAAHNVQTPASITDTNPRKISACVETQETKIRIQCVLHAEASTTVAVWHTHRYTAAAHAYALPRVILSSHRVT